MEAWSCGYKQENKWFPFNLQNIQLTATTDATDALPFTGNGHDAAGKFNVVGSFSSPIMTFSKSYDNNGQQWTVEYKGTCVSLRVLGTWTITTQWGEQTDHFWIDLPDSWLSNTSPTLEILYHNNKFSKYNEAYVCQIMSATYVHRDGLCMLEFFAEGDGSLGPLQPATGSRLFCSSSSATDISDAHQAASEEEEEEEKVLYPLLAEYSKIVDGRNFYRGWLLYGNVLCTPEGGDDDDDKILEQVMSRIHFSFGSSNTYSTVNLSVPPSAATTEAQLHSKTKHEDIEDMIEWHGMKLESMNPVVNHCIHTSPFSRVLEDIQKESTAESAREKRKFFDLFLVFSKVCAAGCDLFGIFFFFFCISH